MNNRTLPNMLSHQKIRQTARELTDNLLNAGGINQRKVFTYTSNIKTEDIINIIIDIINDLHEMVSRSSYSSRIRTIEFTILLENYMAKIYRNVSSQNSTHNFSMDMFLLKTLNKKIFDQRIQLALNYLEKIKISSNESELYLWQELVMWLHAGYQNTDTQVQAVARKQDPTNDPLMMLMAQIDFEDVSLSYLTGVTKYYIFYSLNKIKQRIMGQITAAEMVLEKKAKATILFQGSRQNDSSLAGISDDIIIEITAHLENDALLSYSETRTLIETYLKNLRRALGLNTHPDLPYKHSYLNHQFYKLNRGEIATDDILIIFMKEYASRINNAVIDYYNNLQPATYTLFKPQIIDKDMQSILNDAISAKNIVEIAKKLDSLRELIKIKDVDEELSNRISPLLDELAYKLKIGEIALEDEPTILLFS